MTEIKHTSRRLVKASIFWDDRDITEKPAHWRSRTEWSDGFVKEEEFRWRVPISLSKVIRDALVWLVDIGGVNITRDDVKLDNAGATWEEASNEA